MTRTTRLLGLAMVLALLMALVSTATAAPPNLDPDGRWCSNHPADPKCSTTTTSTTTTTVVPGSLGVGFSCEHYALLNPSSDMQVLSWEPTDDSSDDSSDELDLDLTSGVGACVDLLNGSAGSFKVTVISVEPAPKKNSTLYALIKDSHAGDHCGDVEDMYAVSALNLNLASELAEELADTIEDVPAATLNACGTGYSEAKAMQSGSGEWEVDDATITAKKNATDDPLALMLGISGKPGITANVTITYTADQ
jgi:hypothetical protein